MKKRTLIILITLAVILLAGIAGATYAWLTDEKTGAATFTVGDVTYTLTAPQNVEDVVVPGQNVLNSNPATITNASNVTSNIRLAVTISVTNASNNAVTGWTIGTDATDHISITMDTGWVFEDGYWYYGTAYNASTAIATSVNTITNMTSIMLNGAVIGNTFSGYHVTVNLKLQAKQNDYVTWSDLAAITNFSFSTGLATA